MKLSVLRRTSRSGVEGEFLHSLCHRQSQEVFCIFAIWAITQKETPKSLVKTTGFPLHKTAEIFYHFFGGLVPARRLQGVAYHFSHKNKPRRLSLAGSLQFRISSSRTSTRDYSRRTYSKGVILGLKLYAESATIRGSWRKK